jgi:hypothetical protein
MEGIWRQSSLTFHFWSTSWKFKHVGGKYEGVSSGLLHLLTWQKVTDIQGHFLPTSHSPDYISLHYCGPLSSDLKMEDFQTCISENYIHRTKGWDSHLHGHRRKNLKSYSPRQVFVHFPSTFHWFYFRWNPRLKSDDLSLLARASCSVVLGGTRLSLGDIGVEIARNGNTVFLA